MSSLDFFPTFCDLTGTPLPPDLALDGTNFLPVFENEAPQRNKPLLWIFYNALNERRVAMRDGDWKVLARLNIDQQKRVTKENEALVKAAKLSDFQIFKITDDVGESEDLSASMPDKLAELKQRLETHYKELLSDSHVWN